MCNEIYKWTCKQKHKAMYSSNENRQTTARVVRINDYFRLIIHYNGKQNKLTGYTMLLVTKTPNNENKQQTHLSKLMSCKTCCRIL